MYASIKAISEGQVRMIYGLARKASIDNDLLHDMVKQETGLEHIKALSTSQGKTIIDRLKRTLGEPMSKPQPADRGTAAQGRMIYAIAKDMGWSRDRLRGFLEKRFGVSDVAFLNASSTIAVIEALKSMQAGGRADRRRADG